MRHLKIILFTINALFISNMTFSQSICKCGAATCNIPGVFLYTEIKDPDYPMNRKEYYAEIVEEERVVKFTEVIFFADDNVVKGELNYYTISSFPIDKVCLAFGDGVNCRSQKIKKEDHIFVRLSIPMDWHSRPAEVGNCNSFYCATDDYIRDYSIFKMETKFPNEKVFNAFFQRLDNLQHK